MGKKLRGALTREHWQALRGIECRPTPTATAYQVLLTQCDKTVARLVTLPAKLSAYRQRPSFFELLQTLNDAQLQTPYVFGINLSQGV